MSIGIAVAALLAEQVSGSEKLAGLAQTMQVLGAAVASFLLAHLMSRRGRRLGLVRRLPARCRRGRAVRGGGGGRLVPAAARRRDPARAPTTAANNQSRYAATDLARPEKRARALSVVVWATTIGAVAGPNLTGLAGRAGRALGVPALTGPFLFGLAGMLAAAAVIGVRLRPDPLLVAREAALARGGAARTQPSWGRVVRRGPDPARCLRRRRGARAGARGDGLGDGDDAAAHAPRRRHPRGDRRGDQRPRARHVRVRPGGRLGRRPVRAPAGAGGRCDRAVRRAAALRHGADGGVVPDRAGAVPARPGLVAVHGRPPRPCSRSPRPPTPGSTCRARPTCAWG